MGTEPGARLPAPSAPGRALRAPAHRPGETGRRARAVAPRGRERREALAAGGSGGARTAGGGRADTSPRGPRRGSARGASGRAGAPRPGPRRTSPFSPLLGEPKGPSGLPIRSPGCRPGRVAPGGAPHSPRRRPLSLRGPGSRCSRAAGGRCRGHGRPHAQRRAHLWPEDPPPAPDATGGQAPSPPGGQIPAGNCGRGAAGPHFSGRESPRGSLRKVRVPRGKAPRHYATQVVVRPEKMRTEEPR